MSRHAESDDTSPPIRISERKGVQMPLVMLFGLLSLTATAALAYSNLKDEAKASTREIVSQAERIRRLEENQATIAAMKSDIEWIKRTMERQRDADPRR